MQVDAALEVYYSQLAAEMDVEQRLMDEAGDCIVQVCFSVF
jgi:hypothetical protein